MRDGQLRLLRRRHRGARAPPLADLVRAGQLERVTVTAEAAALRSASSTTRCSRIATSTSADRSPSPSSRRRPCRAAPAAAPTKALVQSEARHKVEPVECAVFVATGDSHRLALRHGDGRPRDARAHRCARATGPSTSAAASPPPKAGRSCRRRSCGRGGLRARRAGAAAAAAPPAPPDDPPPPKTGLAPPRVPPVRPPPAARRGLAAAAVAVGGRAARALSRRPPARPVQREPTQRTAGSIVT